MILATMVPVLTFFFSRKYHENETSQKPQDGLDLIAKKDSIIPSQPNSFHYRPSQVDEWLQLQKAKKSPEGPPPKSIRWALANFSESSAQNPSQKPRGRIRLSNDQSLMIGSANPHKNVASTSSL